MSSGRGAVSPTRQHTFSLLLEFCRSWADRPTTEALCWPFWRLALGARNFHEAHRRAGCSSIARRCRHRSTLFAAMATACRPVRRVSSGPFHGSGANAEHPAVLVMPPSAYAAAARELVTLDWHGEYLRQFSLQIGHWLSGPAESYTTIPLNACQRRHSYSRRRLWPVVRPVAAVNRRLGVGAACCGAVLHGCHCPLSFPDLVPHYAGGHGLVSAGRNRLAAPA